jgi:uracil-DNA glycosylase
MSILIVGEAWGEKEETAGRAFVGSSGRLLKALLSENGIDPRETYMTNVFNRRPMGDNVLNFCGPKSSAIEGYRALQQGKYVRAEFAPELERLYAEIKRIQPNVIIALGNTALWALCKKVGIKKFRGSPLPSIPISGRTFKVLPTWHPGVVLRQYALKPVLMLDLAKARRQAEFPEIIRPSRLILLEPTLDDIEDFYHEHLVGQPFLSCDIETKQRQITEVGYSDALGKHAIVIPFYSRQRMDGNYWPDLESELAAWAWVRQICSEFPLIGQNFQFDMMYFWKTAGITCPLFAGDTMLLHHSLYPELEKGLGFLGSVYTDEPSWKFMRQDNDTLKQADD